MLKPTIKVVPSEHRKAFSDRRVGGNPELIRDTDEWFRDLAHDPALITIQKYIPWSDITPDKVVQENLKGAVTKRINAANKARQEQVNQVIQQRKDSNISAELILWTVTSTTNIVSMIVNATNPIPVTLDTVNICDTGKNVDELLTSCSFTTKMTACALQSNSRVNMTTEVPISYERNLITGDLRVVALRQNGIAGTSTSFKNYDRVGNWVRRGCSEIRNDQCGLLTVQTVQRVQLCSRCRVLCANQNNNKKLKR